MQLAMRKNVLNIGYLYPFLLWIHGEAWLLILWDLFCAIPLVHVNHVEDPNGASVILCSSVGFYPGDLLQVLLMNGQVLNTTNLHREKIRNPDGTFTLNTRLHLSEKVPENVTYSCRVNHTTMSANQVITQKPERNMAHTGPLIAVTGGLVVLVCLVSIIKYMCFRSQRLHPTAVDIDIYSALGRHHPVPCNTTTRNSVL
ncbi:major histocompatibility complex class I-related gene protein-like [Denticeps clupeoides]|uniref:major histocompatibility complex class I-related gene protein-like n=1 Tax=Denticeps clupeoides TaxID=299321 RepID=UPI0010A447C0|nr:major histocompatibility complex class I-related gene protein-like [Denticeps clupeoides]